MRQTHNRILIPRSGLVSVCRSMAAVVLLAALTFSAIACGDHASTSSITSTPSSTTPSLPAQATAAEAMSAEDSRATAAGAAPTTSAALAAEYNESDLDSSYDTTQATAITLGGTSATVSGAGATASGSTVTVTAAGTYVLSGTLGDGQVIVDAGEDAKVKLVLNGVSLTSSSTSPLSVASADKVVLTLAPGTTNQIQDGPDRVFADAQSDEPDAAVFSTADLTINGPGSLKVTGTFKDGIASKDNLKITGGTIAVEAVNDALRGRDCIGIKGGVITVNAGADGLQATNDEDAQRGFVSIDGGTLHITAGTDGVQAETSVLVTAGAIDITSGGGAAGGAGSGQGNWGPPTAASDVDSTSAKGLKAAGIVTIQGGTVDIDAADDAIHANKAVAVNGGVITVATGDDGIHADASLQISSGELTVSQSYEGIESTVITIQGGTVRIASSDDGVNVSGGGDGSGMMGGRPGEDQFVSGNQYLAVTGGYICVDSGGDGLDINGTISMSGGTAIINGPTNDANGALDYLGEFTMTGGYLLAVGSSGMAQAPSPTSTQNSVIVNLATAQQEGALVRIQDEAGADVLTFAPAKAFRSVVLSSPDLQTGATYTVYLGGTATGTAADGLYTAGSAYTPGTQNTSFTVSSVVTTVGQASRGGMGVGGARIPGRR